VRKIATAALLAALTLAPAAPAQAPGYQRQPVVILYSDLPIYDGPGVQTRYVGRLHADRPLTGETTRVPLLGTATNDAGHVWYHVRLPGRPNSWTGWIPARDTVIGYSVWHLVVSTGHRQLSVYRSGRLVKRLLVVVGKPSTPTPRGQFFIEEVVAVPRDGVGAPFALATSARSNVLQEYAGGPGQIALHGTNNIGGTPGTAVSHGCIRVPTKAIRWLAYHIGPGVPLTIKG
jgi:lipoprotein-anchoring transpeptidase ErfK/SrfK